MNSVALKTTGTLPRPVATPSNRAAEAHGLRLEIIHQEMDFLALEPFWDRLLERSATRTPFLRWDWVSLWWNAYRNQCELAIGIIRDPLGEPLAIAPMVLGRGTGSRILLRHLSFIGGIGDIVSEGMDFIIPCGSEEKYAPQLARIFSLLQKRWDTACLPMLPAESPNLPFITAALENTGGHPLKEVRHSSRFITLPATWAELEMQHSANWRSTHRRKWRKAMKDHQGRALLAGRDLPEETAFDALLALHRQRFDASQSLFLDERTLGFHRALLQRWLPAGRAQLSFLKLDGQLAAGTYCYVDDGKSWQYQSGWNPAHSALSIGRLGMGWAIQLAIEGGLREFDFLPGENDHKKLWTDETRELVDIEYHAPLSPSAWLHRSLRVIKRLVKPPKVSNPPPESPTEAAE